MGANNATPFFELLGEQAAAPGQAGNQVRAALLHVFKSLALDAWKRKGVAGVQQRRPFCQPHTHCGRTHSCTCHPSPSIFHESPLRFSSSLSVEHPKWLNLLPGLGVVPAPWGAEQAGGPQLIQLPEGAAARGFQQELNNY